MKRMTKAEMKRRHLIWLLIGIIFVVSGIFLPVDHFVFPHPAYEELQTKEVVVESVDYRSIWGRYYTTHYYYIMMSNGEGYRTCGRYVREMDERLFPGDRVTIKYHKDRINSIDELKKEDEDLVTYVDHYVDGKVFIPVLSVAFLIGGAISIKLYSFGVKNDIRKQENRDKRIKKKYGEKSKIK